MCEIKKETRKREASKKKTLAKKCYPFSSSLFTHINIMISFFFFFECEKKNRIGRKIAKNRIKDLLKKKKKETRKVQDIAGEKSGRKTEG